MFNKDRLIRYINTLDAEDSHEFLIELINGIDSLVTTLSNWDESAEISEDHELMKRLDDARKEFAEGKTHSWKEVFGEEEGKT